ncbi:phosphoribosylformylglycinamidine cyclo-ligase [Nitrososphaera viennensis]|uniref:Phosphoribosylformylglycinamidine cyclo-ligase n=1 Tax=Nitrososphaera viennensis TaxID=1034015 RepID=A0A977NN40_9ARCH|nr:phosphoribosylformylglycinamidine cyclo-ligase [Nitrososphaera viennensis]UVS70579.1 phosphoribosylformylglycinamidine cyclo-ligase [Nitrososphaera viennensis]
MKERRMTYRDAGVDVGKIRTAQKSIGDIISATHKMISAGKVLSGFGHYAGLVRLGSQTLALHSDGVGTKVLVAQLMNKFDTVGIDCVAMNVNDIICVGAKPVAFIDYIALRQANEKLLEQIAHGLVEGAKQSQMAIVGGETAVLPDVIAGEENAFDLAGMVLGTVDGGKPLLGGAIKPGDVILGVESSGLHSNGYTLARKVLLSKYSVDDSAEHLVQTVGEELLIPTRIYVKPVMELFKKKIAMHGLANITGGSFTKLPRLNKNVQYCLDGLPAPTGIFLQIQVDGNIETGEMYRTFNMGIGFCVIAPKASTEQVIRTFKRYKMGCKAVGRIEKGTGVVATLEGKKKQAL